MRQRKIPLLLLVSMTVIVVIVFSSTSVFEQPITITQLSTDNNASQRTLETAKLSKLTIQKTLEPVEKTVADSSESSSGVTASALDALVFYTGFMRVDGANQAMVEMVDANGELLASTVSIGDVLFETSWTVSGINQYMLDVVNNGQHSQIGLAGSPSFSKNDSEEVQPRKKLVINPIDGMIHDPAYGLIDPNNPDPGDDEVALASMEKSRSTQNQPKATLVPPPAYDVQALFSGKLPNNAVFKRLDLKTVNRQKQPSPEAFGVERQ